jgi:AraC-like DNA-binding protein
MNLFSKLTEQPFLVGKTDLSMFLNRPRQLDGGLVFICIRGNAVISTDVIDYEIRVHSKVTLLPGTIFTLQQASPDFKVIFIAFSYALFNEANHRLEPSFSQFLRENPVFHIPAKKVDMFLGAFSFFTSIYQDPENRFRYEIISNQLQCMFWETYDKTYRLFEHLKSSSSSHYQEIFKKFISLIYTHFKEQRDVTFYAGLLCITPRYLSLITKYVTCNETPKELINRHIILEIKVMLQSTHLPVQEIAHQLNFPDQSYLGRYFKRYTGVSPTEYRNNFFDR